MKRLGHAQAMDIYDTFCGEKGRALARQRDGSSPIAAILKPSVPIARRVCRSPWYCMPRSALTVASARLA